MNWHTCAHFNLNFEFISIQHEGRFNDVSATFFHTHTRYSKNTLNRAQSRGWKEYNNGIYDVMLSFSFLKASDSLSHPPQLLAPYFNFRFIIKRLPTSSILVQCWQYIRGKFVFNADKADVVYLLFGNCFLCVFPYKGAASATVRKKGDCVSSSYPFQEIFKYCEGRVSKRK
jgi:hypothetical protein